MSTTSPPVPQPTQAELNSISLAAAKLWELDDNRLNPGVHYAIEVQGKRKYNADSASKGFFRFVDKDYFFKIPTYASFYKLLDNYEKSTGHHEVVTPEEMEENKRFINAILQTRPIKYLHKYLVAAGKANADVHQFAAQLEKLWFGLYAREKGQILDSSGFEHVFVGEVKDGKVIGFHNWVQMFLEERLGHVNYLGYLPPRGSRGYNVFFFNFSN